MELFPRLEFRFRLHKKKIKLVKKKKNPRGACALLQLYSEQLGGHPHIRFICILFSSLVDIYFIFAS